MRNLTHLVSKNKSLFTEKQFNLISYMLRLQRSSQVDFVCNALDISTQSLKMIIHHLNKKVRIKIVNDFVILDYYHLEDFIIDSVYNEEIDPELIPSHNFKQEWLSKFNDYLVNAFHGFHCDLCSLKTQGSRELIHDLLSELIIDDDYESLIQCLFSNTDLYYLCINIDHNKTRDLIDSFKQALLFNNDDCVLYQLADTHTQGICHAYDYDARIYTSIKDFKKNELYIDHKLIAVNFDKASLIEDYFIEFKSMIDFFELSYKDLINKILDSYVIDSCNSYTVDTFQALHENISSEYEGILDAIEEIQDQKESVTLNKVLNKQYLFTDKIMYKSISFNIGAFSKYHELVFTDYLTDKGLI